MKVGHARSENGRPPWLPLLRELTRSSSSWATLKNIDDALDGKGDIDSVAPISEWPLIASAFGRWAAAHEFGPVISCRHLPGSLLLVARPPGSSRLLELHVVARGAFRGGWLFTAEQMGILTELDERGFRRLRPGAEGLLLLLWNGIETGGAATTDAGRLKRIAGLLANDPAGVEAAARALRCGGGPALDLATALVAGSWSRRSALRAEAAGVIAAFGQPEVLASRLAFRFVTARRCAVLRALTAGRRIPSDEAGWYERVALTHKVVGGKTNEWELR